MRVRCLVLSDNMSGVLAFGRCRAGDYRLLLQVRRLASLALCRGIKFVVRRIPSDFNVADGGRGEVSRKVSLPVTTLLGKGREEALHERTDVLLVSSA